jgi:2'-5' RNA ligase
VRLFVAVDLPDETKHAIAVEQKRLAAALTDSRSVLKPVHADQMHLTLLFLGEVPEPRAPALVDAMNTAVDLAAFDLAFSGTGMFPMRGAPRVLWIGVAEGASSLVRLQSAIAARVRELGIAFDDRPFHPHLTIGRWRESRSSVRAAFAAATRRAEIARIVVGGATLYRSHLSSSGATHVPLARANLSGTRTVS